MAFNYEIQDSFDYEEKITIRVGICAMNKKSHSRPMKEILDRLAKFVMFEIVVFPDDLILNDPVDEWPICDALISFFSNGFPLEKAIRYAKLRKPFLLNDLESQYVLLDRQKVYERLQADGVSVPRYAVLRREGGVCDDPNFQESEDAITVHGKVFQKPFVEKPLSAEDHDVNIYFPSQAGGGCQQVFRKIGSLSSRYCDQSQVRKTSSYIYEDFLPTEGTDVKVYTVGPEYVHAEARKSPSLDGKVERDYQGKEIRYPVILSAFEKEIANKVCNIFKQTVCGFDLLRANGLSYVCDVNGFSFVKTSRKYYEDCSQVLGHMILQRIAPQLPIPDLALEDAPLEDISEESMLELRCVMSVVRHGDRTPKQKMKLEVRNQMFIDLFKKYGGRKDGKLKLKKPKQLQEVLNIVRDLLEMAKDPAQRCSLFESQHKLEQLKGVLEMYGHFSGINRKIQFKYLRSFTDDTVRNHAGEDRGRHGYSSGADQKECDSKSHEFQNVSLLLIMKWGGELTPSGKEQAVEMGKAFRCMYPGGRGEYASLPGCGLLRLHSTYRHDLKIYASDEGRVQMTAAAFAKGLLALEGELTPILVHLVRCDKHATKMLDSIGDPQNLTYKIKCRLHEFFNLDKDLTEDDYTAMIPTGSVSQVNALRLIKNPYKMCNRVHSLVKSLTSQLREMMKDPNIDPKEQSLYHNECLDLMVHRWHKLEKDFLLRNGKFDISLIPDIYDCIKYDVFHNGKLNLRDGQELYKCAKALADVVIPQEYGITKDEKLQTSRRTCQHLFKKLLGDLRHADQTDNMHRLDPKYSRDIVTPHRHVRTRLYFTSESHIHTMINAIRYGDLCDGVSDEYWKRTMDYFSTVTELSYMTQIVLMLYEDPQADCNSDKRFHIELHFSPGVKCNLDEAVPRPSHIVITKPEHQTDSSGEREELKDDTETVFGGSDGNISENPSLASSKRKIKSSSDEGLLRISSSWIEDSPSQQRASGSRRSLSEYDYPVRLRDMFDTVGSRNAKREYESLSKSLESIDAEKKRSYFPIQSCSSASEDGQSRLAPEDGNKYLRSTHSTPTLNKPPKVSSLRAALGPVFSVPGVRKLALQSAVPMANVITRQKTPLPSDEPLFPDVPVDQLGEIHSVLSSIHPLKTLHGGIPLRQMEHFLKKISEFNSPDMTPDLQKKRVKALKDKKGSGPDLLRDLADCIPCMADDGIDDAEFESQEGKVTTV